MAQDTTHSSFQLLRDLKNLVAKKFHRLSGIFSSDIGIDLGTANTLVFVRGKGIVLAEPSVVAVDSLTNEVLAVGHKAKAMLGKTPRKIHAVRPMKDGVIADFEIAEGMLKALIKRVTPTRSLFRPRILIAVPSGITGVEKRAVEDSALHAGAQEVVLIEEPMAAAIGARLPIHEAVANVIVDMGGGTTEVAVISMGGLIASRSLRIAGDKLTDDILRYLREERNLLIGEATAENLKINYGSAYPLEEEVEGRVRGRDLVSGLPKEITITSEELREAMQRSIKSIVLAVKNTIEETPPELTADLINRHIFLAGGGALLKGLDKLIAQETKLFVKIVDDPLTAVARGCGFVLENIDQWRPVLVSTEKEAYL